MNMRYGLRSGQAEDESKQRVSLSGLLMPVSGEPECEENKERHPRPTMEEAAFQTEVIGPLNEINQPG